MASWLMLIYTNYRYGWSHISTFFPEASFYVLFSTFGSPRPLCSSNQTTCLFQVSWWPWALSDAATPHLRALLYMGLTLILATRLVPLLQRAMDQINGCCLRTNWSSRRLSLQSSAMPLEGKTGSGGQLQTANKRALMIASHQQQRDCSNEWRGQR